MGVDPCRADGKSYDQLTREIRARQLELVELARREGVLREELQSLFEEREARRAEKAKKT